MVQNTPVVIHCPSCGRPHPEPGHYCPSCGRDLKPLLNKQEREDPLEGQVVAERYRIQKRVGMGGMGAVYRVEHLLMGKVMCMKLLHPSFSVRHNAARRFRQEIKVVSRLSHVHTVSVFDCGTTRDGGLFIIMEYLRGLDLDQALQQEKVLDPIRAARIVRQICGSLGEAHETGVIHRDVKPANVMLLRDRGEIDFVKVLDFGIAKLMEPGQDVVTEAGLIVGTPYYMAPEQAISGGQITPAIDIYSLGVVLYELLTGRLPFQGETPADFIHAHLRQPPPLPSTMRPDLAIDPEIEGIVLRALEKEPRDRFLSIEQMRNAIESYLRRIEANAYRPDPTADPHYRGSAVPPEAYAPLSPTPSSKAPVSQERTTEGFQRETELPPLSFPDEPYPISPSLVATRADWDRAERRLRWSRRLRALIPLFLLLALLGAGAYLYFPQWQKLFAKPHPDRLYTREQEPNHSPLQATSIPLGKDISGKLGKRLGPRTSDRDWFRLHLPKGQHHLLSLSLVPHATIDVELGVYRLRIQRTPHKVSAIPEELLSINNGHRGVEEQIPAYRFPPGDYYILVRELVLPGESPQENLGPYRLRVEEVKPEPGREIEPNDQLGLATTLPLNQLRTGLHDRLHDTDYFRFDLPTSNDPKTQRYRIRFHSVPHTMPEFEILGQDGQPIAGVSLRYPRRKKRRRARRKKKHSLPQVMDLLFSGTGRHYLRIRSLRRNRPGFKGYNYRLPYQLLLERR